MRKWSPCGCGKWSIAAPFCQEVRTKCIIHSSKSVEDFDRFNLSPKFQDLLADAKEKSEKREVHLSQAFNGHLDLKPSA